MLQVNEVDILGEGSFGRCFRGCLQGTPVCLKYVKSTKKEHIMCEASTLSGLSHHAICFLHGVQVEEEPYYLVTNIYLIQEHSITIYDFLCLQDSSSKKGIVNAFRSEMVVIDWCNIMRNIAEGLKYIHSRHIIHRDLKSNNVVLYNVQSTRPY